MFLMKLKIKFALHSVIFFRALLASSYKGKLVAVYFGKKNLLCKKREKKTCRKEDSQLLPPSPDIKWSALTIFFSLWIWTGFVMFSNFLNFIRWVNRDHFHLSNQGFQIYLQDLVRDLYKL